MEDAVVATRLAWAAALVLVLIGTVAPPARAETTNVMFNLPAQMYTNTCAGADPVVMSGEMHIVVATTSDGAGGYHLANSINTASMQGRGLFTQTPYHTAETHETVEHVRPPFPAMATYVHNLRLLAQGAISNYVLSVRLRTVVTADGVPLVTADQVRMDCTG